MNILHIAESDNVLLIKVLLMVFCWTGSATQTRDTCRPEMLNLSLCLSNQPCVDLI